MIAKAILKYKILNFKLDILEYCNTSILINREQYYLDSLNPEYNILKYAGSSLGFVHSEETKLKLSIKNKGINNFMYGKTHSEETKFKIRTSLRETLKNSGKPVKNCKVGIYNSDYKLIKILDSVPLLSKLYNIPRSTVYRYLKTGKIYDNKYYFISL